MAFTKHITGRFLLITTFFLFSFISNYAVSYDGVLKCKSPESEENRVWKYSNDEGRFKLWILYSDNFYPFCTVGHSIQFPNGFLCAYDTERKVGTIATFIDIKQTLVTDILIWEDTVLIDPSTWRQKSETPCEKIVN